MPRRVEREEYKKKKKKRKPAAENNGQSTLNPNHKPVLKISQQIKISAKNLRRSGSREGWERVISRFWWLTASCVNNH